MRLEVVRMVTDALTHATEGVNAMLALVPLDGSDVRPADVTVTSEMDDEDAAQGAVAREEDDPGAELVVYARGGVTEFAGEVLTVDQDAEAFEVLIYYKARESDTAKAQRDMSYTMRAARWALNHFNQNDRAEDRERGDVQIVACSAIREFMQRREAQDNQVDTGLQVVFTVRDLLPFGA